MAFRHVDLLRPQSRSATVQDSIAIAIAVILSLVWYAPQLGFYSDDWAFLARYVTTPDQTLSGFYQASHSPQHASRPVQLWVCAALYWMFGLNPGGHQLITALLVISNALLVYAVAILLRLPRPMALAVALLYGTLPNYSTNRYWFVAVAITLSMTTCLVSIYAEIRAMTSPVRIGLAWKLLGAVALVVSSLAYEVAMPLLLVAPAGIACWVWRHHPGHARRQLLYFALLVAINVVLLAGLSAFKVRTTVRLGAEHGLRAQVVDIARRAVRRDLDRREYGLNGVNAARVHFRDYGVLLPVNALRLARHAPAAVLVLTLVFGILTCAYLAATLDGSRWPVPRQWAGLLLGGIVVFALGYAIFLTNYNVQFTTTGIANRTAIVATLGAAMGIAGGLGWLIAYVRSARARSLTFAGLVAVYAGGGFLCVNAIANYWIEADGAERRILGDIRQRFPTLAPESALILDGVCPYIGPAIVFEADWDLAGALQVMYGDSTLKANVLTPRFRLEADALSFSIYGQWTKYPYSSRLLVYTPRTGELHPITDRKAAEAYFGKALAAWSCPPGHEGIGVEVF